MYGAPSYETVPDLAFEKELTYTGGRDKDRLFHGKGVVEFSDGGYMEVPIRKGLMAYLGHTLLIIVLIFLHIRSEAKVIDCQGSLKAWDSELHGRKK